MYVPLSLQVFNFSLGVKVQQRSQLVGKAEQDMTKLCNHRRKVVAMAALCRSMQASQLPYVSCHTGKYEKNSRSNVTEVLLGYCTAITGFHGAFEKLLSEM